MPGTTWKNTGLNHKNMMNKSFKTSSKAFFFVTVSCGFFFCGGGQSLIPWSKSGKTPVNFLIIVFLHLKCPNWLVFTHFKSNIRYIHWLLYENRLHLIISSTSANINVFLIRFLFWNSLRNLYDTFPNWF